MAIINKQDTDGTKATLLKGELGYDDYVAGGDTGRVYVGDGTTNIGLAKASQVLTDVPAGAVFTDTTYVLTDFGITATATEVNYTTDVTSNIQAQINGKQATITGAATTIDTENLTINRALLSDASGKVGVSAVTSTELGHLDGVTSSIQSQLNLKAPLASPALTGVPTAPTAAAFTNTTQLATTAFVTASSVSSDVTGVTGADQITNMMSLTQAEYDAITTPDAATFYVIVG